MPEMVIGEHNVWQASAFIQRPECCIFRCFISLCFVLALLLSQFRSLSGKELLSAVAREAEPADSWSELLWLAVDKTSLHADLRTLPDAAAHDSRLLQRFRVAIGRQTGDKQKEGDNRTPEGIYFALDHIEADRISAAKYGKKAIPLNFPNPVDRLAEKTGYGIWLHGGDDGRISEAQVTEGCIAFYNADILKLQSWLRPYQAPVVIARDLSLVNRREDREQIRALTGDWLDAWQSQDIGRYIGFYSKDFRQGRYDRAAYQQYKSRVFRSYRAMQIDNKGLWILTHPKYAVSFMNQDFRGDRRFRSVGRKILYWVREKHSWKIIAEKFSRTLFQPLSFSAEDLRKLLPATAASLHKGERL